MTLEQQIELLQAIKDGKTVQGFISGKWRDLEPDDGVGPINFSNAYPHRIDPESCVPMEHKMIEGNNK